METIVYLLDGKAHICPVHPAEKPPGPVKGRCVWHYGSTLRRRSFTYVRSVPSVGIKPGAIYSYSVSFIFIPSVKKNFKECSKSNERVLKK
jgi:hypothetical protein